MTTSPAKGDQTPVVVVHSLDNADGERITFVEYRSFKEARGETISTVPALAISVPAKDCSRIVKALAPLPPALSHLKRVKNCNRHKNNQNTGPKCFSDATPLTLQHPIKRARVSLNQDPGAHGSLLILLGLEPLLMDHFSEKVSSDDPNANLERRLLKIILGDTSDNFIGASKNDPDTALRSILQRVRVPEKPPQSHDQAKQANQLWPTQFFPLKSLEYRHQQLALPKEDMTRMHCLLRGHILNKSFPAAIVVDSTTTSLEDCRVSVLATSWEEQALQQPVGRVVNTNPLATPILWAIQGVARLERQRQIERSKLNDIKDEDSSTRKKQPTYYLCTDYELYCNYEPTVFEAMACVHSRCSRLIFCASGSPEPSHKRRSVWRNAHSIHGIHALPGTNHRFRALEYREGKRSRCETTTAVVD